MKAFVVCLAANPEQLANPANAQVFLFREDLRCSGEGFFTTATPCSLTKTSSIVL
jgi:hypothetical protein